MISRQAGVLRSGSACQFAHFAPCVGVWALTGVSVMQTRPGGKAARVREVNIARLCDSELQRLVTSLSDKLDSHQLRRSC